MNKIKERFLGKFKSNPTPKAGLLARLKIDIDSVSILREEIENECSEIQSHIDQISDAGSKNKISDFVVIVPDTAQASYVELVEKYENIRARFEGKSTDNNPPNQSFNVVQPLMKLKDLDVPEFHGDPRQFTNYKGIFESLVHENPSYSNPQKMSYLLLSLKGEAAKILSDTSKLNLSYPEAWGLVCQWYENKQMIISALFRDLFASKKLPLRHLFVV